MSNQAVLIAVLLLSSIAMTQQPVSAAQPWPTNIDPTADTRSFLLWEDGAPGALGDTDDDKPSLTLFPVRAGPAYVRTRRSLGSGPIEWGSWGFLPALAAAYKRHFGGHDCHEQHVGFQR
jgi:hypothetical protein